MQQTDCSQWLENITSSVDILEKSYKQRLDALSNEYQQDIEALLRSYKSEKQSLNQQLLELEKQLELATKDLEQTQRRYQSETIQHKITKDCLKATRHEVVILTRALQLQTEPVELPALSVNEPIEIDLEVITASDTFSY